MLPIVNEIRRRHEIIKFGRRRRRIWREFSVVEIPEARFQELFRINRDLFAVLCNLLMPYIPEPRYRIRDVSREQKILVALRFYATGCYQRAVGEDFNLGVSQTSVHRYIHEVTNAIEEHICPNKIRFPRTRRERNELKEAFMERFHFAGIIGVIDGSHIAILKPKEQEYNFINRKGFHSLNVQIVCDQNLRIMSVNANYPGSSHDAFVWRNSELRQHLMNLYVGNDLRSSWLIGDSGYGLESFLMTPILNAPVNSPEGRYNSAHTKARNCIERCIGVLKTRFRCLLRERVARYDPLFTAQLVYVCAALHNMCMEFNIPIEDDLAIEDDNDGPRLLGNGNVTGPLYNESLRIRANVVNAYFHI